MQKKKKTAYYPTVCLEKYLHHFLNSTLFELLGSWDEVKNDSTGLPSVNSYASLEDLLRSDAHLVIVNTPVGTHFEYAKKVLLAGNTL
jgi:predicted dehydrogenase